MNELERLLDKVDELESRVRELENDKAIHTGQIIMLKVLGTIAALTFAGLEIYHLFQS